MEVKIEEFSSYIDKKMAELQRNHQSLRNDSREDEAVLCKVRINICDIYKKMLAVAHKKVDAIKQLAMDEKEQHFCREYLDLMKRITSTWSEALQDAKKANDYRAVLVEEIKLETAKDLEDEFQKVLGEPL